jgi:hypothetical protein
MPETIYKLKQRKNLELLNLKEYRLENLESRNHAVMNFTLTVNEPCGVELQTAG